MMLAKLTASHDPMGGTMKYKRSRAEQKQMLIEQGCEFFDGTPKHRFVGIYGDRRIKRTLRRALQWEVFPCPKRQHIPAITVQPSEFDLPIPSSRPPENVHPSA